jgi:branched-chain amino acid transport system substrate-binding protein
LGSSGVSGAAGGLSGGATASSSIASSGGGAGAAGGSTAPAKGTGPGSAAGPAKPGAGTGSTPGLPTPTPGGPAPAPNGAPKATIKVGNVGVASGVLGAPFEPMREALRVWVKWTNAHGGVSGHPVSAIFADDGGDPARHRAAVQKMVEQDKVVAFVADAETLSGRGTIAYHEQVKVPVIGSDTGSPHYYDSTMHFPEVPTGNPKWVADVGAAGLTGKLRNKTKLATLTCVEAQSCGDADSIFGQQAASVGLNVVYRARSSITQPDYTTECLQARNAGAEIFYVVLDLPSIGRLSQSCARQSYKPIFVLGSIAGADQPKDPNLDGATFGAGAFPWFLSNTPARAEFNEAFKTYDPNFRIDTLAATGWTAAKMFQAAIGPVVGDEPKPADVLRGLYALNGTDLGDLTYPLHFTEGQKPPATSCFHLITIRAGAWTSDDGGKLQCR